ncbi:MAG: hypothetical protein LBF56_03905 [Holosporales bacterium]|jgi:hypothetical protein|nr:hypothetical protein [Holosporales bacterium]
MKKWILILSVFTCGVLFFFSGTLIGYTTREKQSNYEETTIKKTQRTTSRNLNPLIGNIIRQRLNAPLAKYRMPTPPALQKAQGYRTLLK